MCPTRLLSQETAFPKCIKFCIVDQRTIQHQCIKFLFNAPSCMLIVERCLINESFFDFTTMCIFRAIISNKESWGRYNMFTHLSPCQHQGCITLSPPLLNMPSPATLNLCSRIDSPQPPPPPNGNAHVPPDKIHARVACVACSARRLPTPRHHSWMSSAACNVLNTRLLAIKPNTP